MDELLDQIELSLKNGQFYLALFASLAVPDICGAIGSRNGKAKGNRYKAWFDKYVAKKYNGNFNGKNCYAFRCAALHQGRAKHMDLGYKQIFFVDPTSGMVLHNSIMNDALSLDVHLFCKDIVSGVRTWLNDMTNEPNFKKNYSHFLKRHKGGLAPFIKGMDVFA